MPLLVLHVPAPQSEAWVHVMLVVVATHGKPLCVKPELHTQVSPDGVAFGSHLHARAFSSHIPAPQSVSLSHPFDMIFSTQVFPLSLKPMLHLQVSPDGVAFELHVHVWVFPLHVPAPQSVFVEHVAPGVSPPVPPPPPDAATIYILPAGVVDDLPVESMIFVPLVLFVL